MLKILRKKGVMKKLLWIVAILIIISFGLMGTASYVSQRNPNNVAGSIFGKKITIEKFTKAYNDTRLQALIRYGDNFENVRDFLDLTAETWDRLILLHAAEKQNIKVSDNEIIEAIEQYPFFQQNNVFNNNIYQQILQHGFRIKPRDFEESIRDMLKIAKLYNNQVSNLSISDDMIFTEYQKSNEKRQISYTLFETDSYKDQASITDDEIQSYYDEHAEEFIVAPNVKLAYITIPIIEDEKNEDDEKEDAITLEIVDEEPLTENIDEAPLPEEAFELLTDNNTSEEVTPSGRDIALAQAETIYDELYLNSNLEEIAAKNELAILNTDFMSMEQPDLSLGWPYNILTKIFQFDIDEISQPFETDNAFTLVQMKEKREAYIPTFEEAQEKVTETVLLKKARKIAQQQALKTLPTIETELIKTKAPNFPKTVKALDFDAKQTPKFSKGQYLPTIGISKSFQEAAFALDENNKLSHVVEVDKGYCILYLDEISPIDEEVYIKEKDTFTKELLAEMQNKHFSDYLIQLRIDAEIEDRVSEKQS